MVGTGRKKQAARVDIRRAMICSLGSQAETPGQEERQGRSL